MLRNFLLTGVVFVLSIGILYTTLQNLDPLGSQKTIALFSFFISIFCGIGAFCTFLFFFGTELFRGRKLPQRVFLISLRRGVLSTLFFTGIVALQYIRFLGVLEVTLLALFLILVEMIFLSSKKN
jgi:hypothetical protein